MKEELQGILKPYIQEYYPIEFESKKELIEALSSYIKEREREAVEGLVDYCKGNIEINNYSEGGEEVAGLFANFIKVLLPESIIPRYLEYLNERTNENKV